MFRVSGWQISILDTSHGLDCDRNSTVTFYAHELLVQYTEECIEYETDDDICNCNTSEYLCPGTDFSERRFHIAKATLFKINIRRFSKSISAYHLLFIIANHLLIFNMFLVHNKKDSGVLVSMSSILTTAYLPPTSIDNHYHHIWLCRLHPFNC